MYVYYIMLAMCGSHLILSSSLFLPSLYFTCTTQYGSTVYIGMAMGGSAL